jgi:hypothetical protein
MPKAAQLSLGGSSDQRDCLSPPEATLGRSIAYFSSAQA